MSLEEHEGVEPLVERKCEVCGASLTDGEMRASMESGGGYLCSVHAAEESPGDPADEPDA
ncbi:MAG: hypothetical protein ACRDSN_22065 [Pseudonocardiaceae bacterium]